MEKAQFKLAGGLIGVLAAANEELVTNDLLMNGLGFGTMFIIVMFTYRSAVAPLLLLITITLCCAMPRWPARRCPIRLWMGCAS